MVADLGLNLFSNGARLWRGKRQLAAGDGGLAAALPCCARVAAFQRVSNALSPK